MGLGLPELIGHAADAASAPAGFGRARACILIHLFGGPSQIDILDLKPDAPEQFRGESRPMPTTTPGLDLCEHLPRLARRSEDFCLIRLMRHEHPRHGWGLYYMLTRRKHPRPDLDALPRLTTFRGRGPWSTGWRRGPSAVTLPGWNRFNDLPNTYSGERRRLPGLRVRSLARAAHLARGVGLRARRDLAPPGVSPGRLPGDAGSSPSSKPVSPGWARRARCVTNS